MEAAYTVEINLLESFDKKTPQVVTFYKIQVATKEATWNIEKRYSQFDALNKDLLKQFSSIPPMPTKSIFKLNQDGVEKRKKDLNEFLKSLVKRPEILSNPIMRSFLEIDSHCSSIKGPSPTCISTLDDLPLGVRDFQYISEDSILFITLGEMKVTSRIDAYLTNVTFPWEKSSDNFIIVGAIVCYKVSKDEITKQRKFTRLWVKPYPVQTSKLRYDPNSHLVGIGLDDGKVNVLKVKADNQYLSFDDIATLKNHKSRINGIEFDVKKGYIYTAAEDCKFLVTDLAYQEKILEVCVGAYPLTGLFYDMDNSRIFVSNTNAQIYIIDILSIPPKVLSILDTTLSQAIKCLYVDPIRCYVFATSANGYISIFDLGKPGKEQFTKLKGHICEKKEQARVIQWRYEQKELIVAYESGIITFFSTTTAAPIYIFDAHTSAVTQMVWDSKLKVLITSSKDKTLKIWKLPDKWTLLAGKTEEKPVKPIEPTATSSSTKSAEVKKKNDSDSDSDLEGWND